MWDSNLVAYREVIFKEHKVLSGTTYHSDSTASHLLSKVKHCQARLVLRLGAMLESLALFFCFLFFCR
jgi:hypothetical protein